jgi:cytoskeletal protein RodZ
MKHSPEVKAVRQKLASHLAQDKQQSVAAAVRRCFEDPLRPRSEDGRFRPSAIILLMAVLTMLSILTFIGFTVVRP